MEEHASEDQLLEAEEANWRIEVILRYLDYLEDCGDDEVPMSLSSFREDLEESMIAEAERRDEVRLWQGGVW